MKKIAFFVEGFTELSFLSKFIEESYNKKRIAVTSVKVKGGTNVPISFTTISADSITDDTQYMILIYNCGGETNIRSYIEKQRESLIREGYSKIIGLRDVYPQFKREEIYKLTYGLYFKLSQTEIRTDFILSIMEIEAFFLTEYKHFKKIHPTLNSVLIKSLLAFDPTIDKMELRDSPASDLHNCYQLVGESYLKDNTVIKRTIDSLDYLDLYFTHSKTLTALGQIKSELDNFLTT